MTSFVLQKRLQIGERRFQVRQHIRIHLFGAACRLNLYTQHVANARNCIIRERDRKRENLTEASSYPSSVDRQEGLKFIEKMELSQRRHVPIVFTVHIDQGVARLLPGSHRKAETDKRQ